MTTKEMKVILNEFLHGCIFRHGNLTLERDELGMACYQCERCYKLIAIPWVKSSNDNHGR